MSNKIALFVGPSGSGKTTVANYMKDIFGLTQIDSYTTRPRRYPEEGGHTYITNEEFDKLTDMVAYTEFDGNRYCATTQQVEENDIYVVDVAGVEYFKEHYHGKKGVYVFYFSVPTEELQRRMAVRGDGGLALLQRMQNDLAMFANAEERLKAIYPNTHIIQNEQIGATARSIWKILQEGRDDG